MGMGGDNGVLMYLLAQSARGHTYIPVYVYMMMRTIKMCLYSCSLTYMREGRLSHAYASAVRHVVLHHSDLCDMCKEQTNDVTWHTCC